MSCVEKIKVLTEALGELRQLARDACEDALVIGCDGGVGPGRVAGAVRRAGQPVSPGLRGVRALLRPGLRSALALAGAALLAPAAAGAAELAVLQGLDKTTARISTITVPVGGTVGFGALRITVRACVKKPPEEAPETAAFLEISEIRPGQLAAGAQRIFSGWMFKESPAISALEDPVYDVTVLDCRTQTGSPDSSPGK